MADTDHPENEASPNQALKVTQYVTVGVKAADVQSVRLLGVDIIIILKNGERLVIPEGGVRAMMDPDFKIRFSDRDILVATLANEVPGLNAGNLAGSVTPAGDTVAGIGMIPADPRGGERPSSDTPLGLLPLAQRDASAFFEPLSGFERSDRSAPPEVLIGQDNRPNTDVQTVALTPQGPVSDFSPMWKLGIGAGMLAGLAGAGGGTAAAAAASTGPMSTLIGTVLLGPVSAPLKVTVYDKSGNILGTGFTNTDGSFSINVSYTGAVLVAVSDYNGAASDFTDETLGLQSLGTATVRAATTVSANASTTIFVTPLTELAVTKMVGTQNIAPDATLIADVNKAIGALYLGANLDPTTAPVIAVNDTKFAAATAAEQKYGTVLAAISGYQAGSGANLETVITQVAAGLTVAGSSATYTTGTVGNSAAQVMVDGAQTYLNVVAPSSQTIVASMNAVQSANNVFGNPFVRSLAAHILDVQGQTKSNGYATLGNTISMELVLDQSVTVTGRPSIKISIGGVQYDALYQGGSGSNALTFSYTAIAGNTGVLATASIDGTGANLLLNGGSIANAAGLALLNSTVSLAGSATVTVDTVAPSSPTLIATAGIENFSIAGGSAGAVVVAAESGASVDVKFSANGHSVSKTLTATGTGSAQAVLLSSADLSTLGEGAVTVSATATDVAGNISSVAATTFVLSSTVSPPVLTVANSYQNASRASAAQGAISVTADVNASVSVVFQANGQSVTKTLAGTGNAAPVVLSASDVTALGNGTVSVSATAHFGGQDSAVATSRFVIDSVKPLSPALTPAAAVENAAVALGLAGAVSVSAESGSTLQVNFQANGQSVSKSLSAIGSLQGVQLTASDLVTLGQGTITVSATATDPAGNISDAGSTSFVLNNAVTPPVLAAGASIENAARAATGAVTLSADAGAIVSVVFTANGQSVSKSINSNGSATAVALSAADLATLGQGKVDVSATAHSAGQDSASVSTSFVLDTLTPNAPVLLAAAATEGALKALNSAGAITVAAESGASVLVTFAANGQSVSKTLTGSGAAQPVVLTSVDLMVLGQGAVSVSASATDLAGNTSALGSTSFILDTLAPTAPVLTASAEIGRARVGKECASMCRSRWSPYH